MLSGFEKGLQGGLLLKESEKTFIDKILARQDADEIKEIMLKEELTRSDMLKLLYLVVGIESKLVNYKEWDRYISCKFYVWIREVVKIREVLWDYELRLKTNKKYVLSERTKAMLWDSSRKLDHGIKALVDVFLMLARTTLSINAGAFKEIMETKFEISYPSGQQQTTPNRNTTQT